MFSTLTESLFSSFTSETNVKLIVKSSWQFLGNKVLVQIPTGINERQRWSSYYMRLPGNFRLVLFNKRILSLYLAMILHWFFFSFYLIPQKLGRLKKMNKAWSEYFIWFESMWLSSINLCPFIPAVCMTVLLNGKAVMQFSKTHWNKTF